MVPQTAYITARANQGHTAFCQIRQSGYQALAGLQMKTPGDELTTGVHGHLWEAVNWQAEDAPLVGKQQQTLAFVSSHQDGWRVSLVGLEVEHPHPTPALAGVQVTGCTLADPSGGESDHVNGCGGFTWLGGLG